MTDQPGAERRKYDRYETEIKIQFYVSFDMETRIDFRVKDKSTENYSRQKYSAISRNISAEGVCFSSEKKLAEGDILALEVYIPAASDPITMGGEVKWSRRSNQKVKGEGELYDTGALLITVNGEPVEKSIVVDNIHNVVWSSVLESIFGNFVLERGFIVLLFQPRILTQACSRQSGKIMEFHFIDSVLFYLSLT